MKTQQILLILALASLFVVTTATVSEAGPMATAFTYQGRLVDANNAANGLYDFQFKLFDAVSGPSQVGSDVNVPGVDVMDGYFTVELDFGAVFDGDARWLEIGVRSYDPFDVNAFDGLLPRQELTPTPYAIYAGKAEDANTVDGLDSLDFAMAAHAHDAAQITSGTLNAARYSAYGDLFGEGYLGNGSGDLAQNNGILQPNLNADMLDGQHGSYYRNASSLNAGTVAEARLPQNAIDGSEIQDGTIADADISTSANISASKIDGTALTYSTDGYPPRSASSVGNGFLTASSSYTTVTSVSITLPASGYVFAQASGAAGYWDGTYEGAIAIGFGSTSEEYWTERWFYFNGASDRMPVSTSRIYYMGAGTHTIYFLAKRISGSGQTWLPRYSLSVIFIDLGSTGAAGAGALMEPTPGNRPQDGVGR
jgi:hypothetical protein